MLAKLLPLYGGMDVFDLPMSEFFRLLAIEEWVTSLGRPGENFLFPEDGINLWGKSFLLMGSLLPWL